MKRALIFLFVILLLQLNVSAKTEIEEKIIEESGINGASEIIPDSLKNSEDTGILFNPSGTPKENGMSFTDIVKHIMKLTFKSLGDEVRFVLIILAFLTLSSLSNSFISGFGNGGISVVLRFVVSVILSSLLISHISGALDVAREYVEELTTFITGLLPFIGSVSLIGGEISTSAVNGALVLSAVTLLQTALSEIAIPVAKIILSFSVVGYVSELPLGALSEFLNGFVTKLITISFGILSAIIYFQNSVATVTDSLALRSIKLAAGNFIPIVGGFVSEASGTLISGVRLVKSTFGVFAICVLIYMTAIPIVNFTIKKISLRISVIISKFVKAEKEAKVFSELMGVYNILLAIMVASTCFFIFSISIFIKSEVG